MEQLKHFLTNLVPSDAKLGRIGSMEITIWLAQIFGLPYVGLKAGESRNLRIFVINYGVISIMAITFVYTTLEWYHLILNRNNLEILAQNMCLSLTHLAGLTKILNSIWRLPDLKQLAETLSHTTKKFVISDKQQRAFARGELENKLLLFIYASMVATTGLLGISILIFKPDNFAGQKFPYCVQLPAWLPRPVQLTYMAIAVLWIAMQIVSTDFLNVTLINQIRYQLNILIVTFDEMEMTSFAQAREFLHLCIQHHCTIIELRNRIESIYRIPILLQFFTSLIIFAMTGFCATVSAGKMEGTSLIYLYSGCIFCELFFYCWFGNEVYEKSRALATSGFGFSWYEFDESFKKSLLIFMTNAQRPFLFTAGGFMSLSLPSFAGILSKSYSYIALLRQLYSD